MTTEEYKDIKSLEDIPPEHANCRYSSTDLWFQTEDGRWIVILNYWERKYGFSPTQAVKTDLEKFQAKVRKRHHSYKLNQRIDSEAKRAVKI